MSETPENKEMKTSGLRPPTKIPSIGVSRLPSSSSIKLDGVKSTVTKLNGGSTAKTADMAYVNKYNGLNKKTIDDRKSSSGSDSFAGDARRLSEAGVRRSSGNSVVLTEDTDKFIIGNRIWVGGTKPGQIAYIGETNFGNGDWAGVVLDEPIGKNDGSVGGSRYFQCEPKKGIFARLTNLTSAPLSCAEDSMIQSSFVTTKPLGFSTPMPPKRQGSTVVPVKTSPKSVSQQPTSKFSNDLKIGDRVIISSGQGSKLGVLRYRGATQFAPGEWCGIELDDPLGKNNGIVEGIKYFECEDKFGLFAPIAKVSKSPMSISRMSTNCAIHKTKRSPGSMNGSMVSNITSKTMNTMSSIPTRSTKVSDLDRLKLQLTQMKNENELLRLQVTKAANQADVAEKRLEETLKAQNDGQSDTQVNGIIMLQNQLDNMKKQMDEEKEKVQNLQFTNEEQNVVSIELQNKNSELLIKIKELEFDLDKERNLTKDVEKEKMKIFEKEEELCRVKEELESLKKVIDDNEDELQKSVSNLSSEVVDKDALLNTLRQTLNENSQTYDRLLKEANEKLSATTERLNKMIEEKDKKIEQSQEMIEQLNEGIKCLSALKNEEHDDIVNNLNNELSKLKDECKVMIDKKEQDIKISSENHIKIENELKQELKNLSENKDRKIEQLHKEYTDLGSTDKNVIEKLILELHIANEDLKALKTKHLVDNKKSLKAILEQQIQSNIINVDNLNNQFNKSLLLKDKQIETCNINLIQIKEKLINSKSTSEIAFSNKIKEKDIELKFMLEKLNTITNDFEKLEKVNQNINIELKIALKSLQDKTILVADLEKKYNDLESQHELNRNELEKKLMTKLKSVSDELICLKSEKMSLEEKHEHYVKETTDRANVVEDKMNQNDILIKDLNKSLSEIILSKKNELHSMNQQVLQLEKEREQILKYQNSELATKDELINTLTNKLEQALTEKQKQDLRNANLQTELTNEATQYQITINDLHSKIIELEVKIASNQESFQKKLDSSINEKETIKLENVNLINELKSLEDSKLNLEEKLVAYEVSKQDIQNLNEVISDKSKIINDYQKKISLLDDLIVQTKNEYQVILKEKDEKIKKLSEIGEERMKMEKLSLEEKSKVIFDEKDKENLKLKTKIKDLENMKINFEKELEVSDLQKQDLNKLNEVIQEKIKTIESNNLKIEQLNNLISQIKNEFEAKLQKKEDDIIQLSKTGEQKLIAEKEQIEKQTKAILDEKNKECFDLLEKIHILKNTKESLEDQLENSKKQENIIIELKNSIEEKTKIINDNNLKIEQLNSMTILSKEEYNAKLNEKEDKVKEFIQTEKNKLIEEKLVLEKNTKMILEEKDKEISNLTKKLNSLDSTQLNFEKQLEISKSQEHDITELKKSVEIKTKIIDDDNSKIEQLNSLISQTKADVDAKLKEKENKIAELVKMGEEKLTVEKVAFETRIKACLDEKNTEIEVLKNKLQELIENNTEKELMLKLESVINKFEEEKNRALSLEKSVLECKNELELLETSKVNMKCDMAKTIEEQQNLNAKLLAKIKIESEKLDNEKLQFQKQIDKLKIEYSTLQSMLDEKNQEIEHLKIETSQKLKTANSDNDELNRLKSLIEKERSAYSHLEFRIQELTDENHRLNERIEGDDNLQQKNNNVAQEKYNIEKKYEETNNMLNVKENQILVLQAELCSLKLKDMEKRKNNNAQENTDKTEAYLLANKNEEIKMLNSIILGLHKKLSAVMETDISEFEVEKNPNSISKEDYQKLYKTAKNNVKLKECENLSLKQEVYKLKTENNRYSEFKTKCESLENDKKTLQKLIVNYESSFHLSNIKNEKTDTKSETEKILEEKDWQINLLNNIIADLHAKVSDNKFKIDALEKQILDSGIDQNKKVRLRTTRLYCEQCEIFDSHDTEDCIKKPESPKFQRKRKLVNDDENRSIEEPFCVCCDMFGHTANECDNSLTF